MWDLVKFLFFCVCLSVLFKACDMIDMFTPKNIEKYLERHNY